jgi:hypothetical protein
MRAVRAWRLIDGRLWRLGVASAVVFGVLEGLALTILRDYPALRASYKVSPASLWVAPLVSLAVFTGTAVCLSALARLGVVRSDHVLLRLAFGTYIFLGLFALLDAPGILHPAAAGVLALGVSVATSRGVSPRIVARCATPTVSVVAMLLVPALTLGVIAAERMAEAREAARVPDGAAGRPNVLLIVLDTVRRDSVGGTSGLTPNLDRLAGRGVTYANAWSTSSWSLPTQASILTGQYPHEHGADWPTLALRPASTTLAETLLARGYVTGAFSSNASWVTPEYLGRGFLRFDVYRMEDLLRRTTFGRALSRVADFFGLHYSGRGKPASQLNAEFLNFLDTYPDRPFFAYLCYMDANRILHRTSMGRPFWQPAATPREIRLSYDAGVGELDAAVGELLSQLQARSMLQNTLLVVTSDHGESFGPTLGDRTPEGHGTSLYPEQTRVPLIVVHPNGGRDGAVVVEPVSIRAVPATVLHALDMDDQRFGHRLPDRSDGGAPARPLLTLNYADRRLQSVVWADSQLIVDRATGQEELLDARTGQPAAGLVDSASARRLLEAVTHVQAVD